VNPLTPFDARRAALVLIDLQQYVLARTWTPHSSETVLLNSVALAKAVRAAGGCTIFVRVDFDAAGRDRLSLPVDFGPPGPIPSPESSGFHSEIAALQPDIVIVKRQWSAFYGTELDLQLRRRNISHIFLVGLATNFGVESTAREAWQGNYSVTLVEDATSSVGNYHEFAVKNIFPHISQVKSTQEVLASLRSLPSDGLLAREGRSNDESK